MDKQKCYNLFEFIQAGDQQEQNNLQLTKSSTIALSLRKLHGFSLPNKNPDYGKNITYNKKLGWLRTKMYFLRKY